MSDNSLISQFYDGDINAWKEIHKKFNKQVLYAINKIIEDSAETEDIFQGSLQELFQRKKAFKTLKEFEAYLFKTALNKARNYLKKAKRERKKSLEYARLQSNGADIKNVMNQEMLNSVLWAKILEIIEQHPPERREVFKMFYLNKMSAEEIAEKKGINRSNVYSYKNTLLDDLKEKLGPDLDKLIDKYL